MRASHQQHDDCRVLIRLFDEFQVTLDGRTIAAGEWRLANAAALVKLLALAPGWRLHREQLTELLWPDSTPAAAANSLRYALYVARRTLAPEQPPDEHLIQYREGWLSLDASAGIWVDVEAFEQAAGAAAREQDLRAHRLALELYAGELLPDDRYEDWAIARRELLQQRQLEVLRGVARLHLERNEPDLAIDALQQVVQAEPVDEAAHVELMRLFAGLGLRHQALIQYHRMRKALEDGLDAEPSAAAQQAYREIVVRSRASAQRARQSQRATAASADRSGRRTSNLPAALTSFVGRETEVAELRQAILDQRLVTLTGPGGAGKTRLALQVAESLETAFQDGVWLIDLSGTLDPLAVTQQLASALNIRDRPGHTLEQTVELYLRGKRLLLVFDNCEHLRDACARLVYNLLRACPELHVLATSRAFLHVPGEAVRQVPPLSFPDGEDGSLEDLDRYEAVDLFVARARLVCPDFELTPDVAPAVVEICRRLDGLPLAIELAAARMRTIPIDALVARLAAPLSLLDDGSRVVSQRHQTLRAAIEWSFGLLSQSERILARRLAVFGGGWTVEGALEVVTGARVPAADVTGLLADLADESLVQVVAGAETARYRFLETIRQYALEELERAGEADEIRLRHARYFIRQAEAGDARFRSPEQTRWMSWWSSEHDNLRAALSFLVASARRPESQHVCSLLTRFWTASGRLTEGRRWFARVLADGTSEPTSEAMRALFGDGRLAYAQGDFGGAAARFGMSLEFARKLQDEDFAAGSLVQLGHVAVREGDFDIAREHYDDGLAIRRHQGDGWYIAVVLDGLGQVATAEQDYSAARAYCEESLELYRRSGDRAQIGRSLALLGHLDYLSGDFQTAHDRLAESLSHSEAAHHRQGMALALAGLGHVAVARGDAPRSTALFERSRKLYAQIGARRVVTNEIDALAWPPAN